MKNNGGKGDDSNGQRTTMTTMTMTTMAATVMEEKELPLSPVAAIAVINDNKCRGIQC